MPPRPSWRRMRYPGISITLPSYPDGGGWDEIRSDPLVAGYQRLSITCVKAAPCRQRARTREKKWFFAGMPLGGEDWRDCHRHPARTRPTPPCEPVEACIIAAPKSAGKSADRRSRARISDSSGADRTSNPRSRTRRISQPATPRNRYREIRTSPDWRELCGIFFGENFSSIQLEEANVSPSTVPSPASSVNRGHARASRQKTDRIAKDRHADGSSDISGEHEGNGKGGRPTSAFVFLRVRFSSFAFF